MILVCPTAHLAVDIRACVKAKLTKPYFTEYTDMEIMIKDELMARVKSPRAFLK
jgi:hypothetical protein